MKALKSFMITLIIVLVIGCIFIVARGSIMKSISKDVESAASREESSSSKANPVTKAIVSKTLDTYIENTSNDKVKEIAESMTEEDKDTVTEIIANNVNVEDIPEVQSYISSGDTQGMLEYAQDNLSDEEVEQLKDIMSKYVTP
ncbi:hypothetical protein [Butyrivibrio sp. FCS014]|uniref:hypothetical protein n=1 Tax=Butyrivibrio sp. FCS014 TaxID=1408304 RepID=UPI0004654212|nr:hypothetical protein [Butyrivibrio sp. FCS014]